MRVLEEAIVTGNNPYSLLPVASTTVASTVSRRIKLIAISSNFREPDVNSLHRWCPYLDSRDSMIIEGLEQVPTWDELSYLMASSTT
jgi:hypothetical protein